MNRIIWMFSAAMIAMASMASAQSQRIGVTGGVNISNFNGISNASTKNGSIIGGFIEYDLGGLAIQPEVLFSEKGAKGSTTVPFGSQQYTWTANYVEVPVLLKLDVLNLTILPMNVDVYAGPDFAFNVSSQQEATDYGPPPIPVTVTTDEKSNTRPFDFNIAVGGGPNLDLGLMTVGAELRYTFGTGSAFKSGGTGMPFGNAKNGVWSIMASVGF